LDYCEIRGFDSGEDDDDALLGFDAAILVSIILRYGNNYQSCRTVDSSADTTVSEKHTVSIFRAEVARVGSGRIYRGLEIGKNEGRGQSGTRNEREMVPLQP
jgi:hypothetical protein